MAAESVDVTARTYHTENGVEHVEGETYAVTDRELAETLVGIGFVTLEGETAPEGRRVRPDHGLPGDKPGKPGVKPEPHRGR